ATPKSPLNSSGKRSTSLSRQASQSTRQSRRLRPSQLCSRSRRTHSGLAWVPAAFEGLKGRADALYLCTDALVDTNRNLIASLALAARLPTMHGFRELAEAAGLLSYGPSFPDLFRRAADHVDKILRGAKPGDIPVEQPTKFELVINMKTAKVL